MRSKSNVSLSSFVSSVQLRSLLPSVINNRNNTNNVIRVSDDAIMTKVAHKLGCKAYCRNG